MGIVAVGVKDYQLPSTDISVKIAFPKNTVDKTRLDLPIFSLKCSKKPGESRTGVHAPLPALAQPQAAFAFQSWASALHSHRGKQRRSS